MYNMKWFCSSRACLGLFVSNNLTTLSATTCSLSLDRARLVRRVHDMSSLCSRKVRSTHRETIRHGLEKNKPIKIIHNLASTHVVKNHPQSVWISPNGSVVIIKLLLVDCKSLPRTRLQTALRGQVVQLHLQAALACILYLFISYVSCLIHGSPQYLLRHRQYRFSLLKCEVAGVLDQALKNVGYRSCRNCLKCVSFELCWRSDGGACRRSKRVLDIKVVERVLESRSLAISLQNSEVELRSWPETFG